MEINDEFKKQIEQSMKTGFNKNQFGMVHYNESDPQIKEFIKIKEDFNLKEFEEFNSIILQDIFGAFNINNLRPKK